jgi:hypothetical protein
MMKKEKEERERRGSRTSVNICSPTISFVIKSFKRVSEFYFVCFLFSFSFCAFAELQFGSARGSDSGGQLAASSAVNQGY